MSYDINTLTDQCYEGTVCLINKLDIRDEKQLEIAESHITLAKISMLSKNPLSGRFDFAHLKAVHKFIFEDLYDWAGEIRTVDMSKKGTSFAKAEEIEILASACFQRLKEQNFFIGLDREAFIENMTDFYCVTNYLHPFREGNGRAQRVFLAQLSKNAGYEMDYTKIVADDLMIATVQAANGVDSFLKEVLKRMITPIS